MSDLFWIGLALFLAVKFKNSLTAAPEPASTTYSASPGLATVATPETTPAPWHPIPQPAVTSTPGFLGPPIPSTSTPPSTVIPIRFIPVGGTYQTQQTQESPVFANTTIPQGISPIIRPIAILRSSTGGVATSQNIPGLNSPSGLVSGG